MSPQVINYVIIVFEFEQHLFKFLFKQVWILVLRWIEFDAFADLWALKRIKFTYL